MAMWDHIPKAIRVEPGCPLQRQGTLNPWTRACAPCPYLQQHKDMASFSGIPGPLRPTPSTAPLPGEGVYESFGSGELAECLPRRSQPCPVLSHREEVQAALSSLRASRWIDHSTRSVSVHFTLFHAPSRLFTSVSLGVEILPSGALIPSPQVDSVGILRSDSALGHCLMLSEVCPVAQASWGPWAWGPAYAQASACSLSAPPSHSSPRAWVALFSHAWALQLGSLCVSTGFASTAKFSCPPLHGGSRLLPGSGPATAGFL